MPPAETTGIENALAEFVARKNASGGELMLFRDPNDLAHSVRTHLRSNCGGLRKMTGWNRSRFSRLACVRHRQQIRIRMLHFRETLRRPHDLPQTFIVE